MNEFISLVKPSVLVSATVTFTNISEGRIDDKLLDSR